VELTFDSFDAGETSCFGNNCMTIRDGLGSSSGILATLCDKRANFPIPLRSSGNTMSMEIFGQWKGKGFKVRYQAIDLEKGGRDAIQYTSLFMSLFCTIKQLRR